MPYLCVFEKFLPNGSSCKHNRLSTVAACIGFATRVFSDSSPSHRRRHCLGSAYCLCCYHACSDPCHLLLPPVPAAMGQHPRQARPLGLLRPRIDYETVS